MHLSDWFHRFGATLDRRFWLIALGVTGLTLFVLGVPTAVIPNPFFVRMTPTEPSNLAVWLISAPLIGLVMATYMAPVQDLHPGVDAAPTRVGLASVGAFLAIGCPVCNKVVVALLGVSGALSVFAPIQPIIGAASIALLAGSLAWRLRDRALGCARCATGPTTT
jgi:hypothetical protein